MRVLIRSRRGALRSFPKFGASRLNPLVDGPALLFRPREVPSGDRRERELKGFRGSWSAQENCGHGWHRSHLRDLRQRIYESVTFHAGLATLARTRSVARDHRGHRCPRNCSVRSGDTWVPVGFEPTDYESGFAVSTASTRSICQVLTGTASALARTDPPALSRNDPALATRRVFPLTLFL